MVRKKVSFSEWSTLSVFFVIHITLSNLSTAGCIYNLIILLTYLQTLFLVIISYPVWVHDLLLAKVLVLNKTACGIVQFIPSRFVTDRLEERTHEVILRRPNRKEKWLVRYHYSSYRRCFQNLEFFKFVRDNKLHEGDICIFELMKGAKRATTTVYVIRKVDNLFVLVN